MSNDFGEIYSRSLKDPERFWSEAAESIHWEKRWDTVLDVSTRHSTDGFAAVS